MKRLTLNEVSEGIIKAVVARNDAPRSGPGAPITSSSVARYALHANLFALDGEHAYIVAIGDSEVGLPIAVEIGHCDCAGAKV